MGVLRILTATTLMVLGAVIPLFAVVQIVSTLYGPVASIDQGEMIGMIIALIIGSVMFITGKSMKQKLDKLDSNYKISENIKPKIKKESGEDSALEILKKRYAGGEISEEEFNKIKKDLE